MAERKEESFGIIPLRHTGEDWHVFVILHKQGNHWGFPKGNPDPSETPLESAKRELTEETGLKVEKILTDAPIIETYSFYRDKVKIFKTVHYFAAIVSGVFLLQPEEIRDGKWLSFAEAKKILTFDEAKALCAKIEQKSQKWV